MFFNSGCTSLQNQGQRASASDSGFETIFNGENLDGWYYKIRDGDDALAEKVFAVDNGVIHIFNDAFPDEFELDSDNRTHAMLYTEKVYSKYILRFEYKWGTRIANNFKDWQYDSGVYYHITNDRVWPKGIEYQVRYDHTKSRNHTGDLIRGDGYVWYGTEADKGIDKTYLHPNDGGKLDEKKFWYNHATPTDNHNALNGKWNQCEIIVMGEAYAIHKLNGDVINMAFDLEPASGVIGFQAETAEILYRNIQIKEFEEIVPAEVFLD